MTDADTEAGKLIEAVNCAQNEHERWDAIAKLYRGIWKFVKVTPKHRWAFDTHAINFVDNMSPIELDVWSELKHEGVVMYPQHPVGRFFVDFGHPVARVAIECDGREWHQDKAKDAARQLEIQSYGWRVFRLTGSECRRQNRHSWDEDGMDVVELSPAAELVREIGREYGLAGRFAMNERVVQ